MTPHNMIHWVYEASKSFQPALEEILQKLFCHNKHESENEHDPICI